MSERSDKEDMLENAKFFKILKQDATVIDLTEDVADEVKSLLKDEAENEAAYQQRKATGQLTNEDMEREEDEEEEDELEEKEEEEQ